MVEVHRGRRGRARVRRLSCGKLASCLLLLSNLAFVCPGNAAAITPKMGAASAVIKRMVPERSEQFTLRLVPSTRGLEQFSIGGRAGHIELTGTDASALLMGFNWYLKYVVHAQLSANGNQLRLPAVLPAPERPITQSSLYRHRFALNQTATGYAAPYWDWARWEHEIDVMAVSGINEVLVYTGMEEVLYQTFREFDYSDEELRGWIVMPAHQPWLQMGNMCCFGGAIPRALIGRRVLLAKQIVSRLRELGMTPVFPGYYGMVPTSFAAKHPDAHVIVQGKWGGFDRPDWLDPRDPLFAKIAAAYYAHERALFGESAMYEMDLFQEGGKDGGVPVAEAAQDVQQALSAANPGATWAMLGWLVNPLPATLQGLDKQHVLILDLGADRYADYNREQQWKKTPRAFGAIWEFGGKGTIGGNLVQYAERMPKQRTAAGSTLAGIAVMPESWDNNPVIFDLVTEMAWSKDPVDLSTWLREYAGRRYGGRDAHAEKAWELLQQTAYGTTAGMGAEAWDEQAESLFNAQPALHVVTAATWGTKQIRYDAAKFDGVLTELLAAGPALRGTETYRYDLVTIADQVLANHARELLPEIGAAYEAKDEARFGELTERWLGWMRLQDALLATDRTFLLGAWLERAKRWGQSDGERAQIEYDARSILTSWGDRAASEGGLHDYANKDWAGITTDLYARRWELYFASLEEAMKAGTSPEKIDWFAVDDGWNRERKVYAMAASGDAYGEAMRVCREVVKGCER